MSLYTEVKQIAAEFDAKITYGNIYSFEDFACASIGPDIEFKGPFTIDTWRWGTIEQVVFIRGDEIVAVSNREGSGDSESEWFPSVYEAEAKQTVEYIPKKVLTPTGQGVNVGVADFS